MLSAWGRLAKDYSIVNGKCELTANNSILVFFENRSLCISLGDFPNMISQLSINIIDVITMHFHALCQSAGVPRVSH